MANLPGPSSLEVKNKLRTQYVILIIFQIVMIILYGVFVRYPDQVNQISSVTANETHYESGVSVDTYPLFQDVHVMIFIGFGFLMTFLKKYCFSALGFNWLLSVIVIQWSLLCQSLPYMSRGVMPITIKSLLEADIMAATILISMGALLGRTTPLQLLIMALIETPIASLNLYMHDHRFEFADVGGSIAIHTFGAYFGLAVSFVLRDKNNKEPNELEGSSYVSDVTAMIGSIFLFIFWPSFNAGLAMGDDGTVERTVINTYLSLAASTVAAFAVSQLTSHEGKFDMVHIQNATLAGGVAIGSVSNMYVNPFGALIIGSVSGTFSVLGYEYLTPLLASKIGLKDTCGVHNLHGMPGVFSGILSVIFSAMASRRDYGDAWDDVFPHCNDPKKACNQYLIQLASLGITLLIAIVSGIITGFILKLPFISQCSDEEKFKDSPNWKEE